MSKSVLSNEKKCFFCGDTRDLHRHHIYYGIGNRSLSEKHGCWVWICAKHHNMSNRSVHMDRDMDLRLKQYCQRYMESNGWTREDFMEVFGRSYI